MEYGHSGNARKAKTVLVVGDDEGDLTIACDDLSGWPDGDSGLKPFWASLGRGGLSEEKVLCESRVGNTLHVLAGGRGGDDTPISTHPIDTVVEHVWTAAEADDSTHHINSVSDVHGVDGDVVGTTDEQTLTNKTLDAPIINDPIINDPTITGLVEVEEFVTENMHDSVISNSSINNATVITTTGEQTPSSERVRPIIITNEDPSSAQNGTILLRTDGVNKGIKARISGAWTTILSFVYGVPAGGTTGQVLTKASGADGDTGWTTPSSGGGGGGGLPSGGNVNDVIVNTAPGTGEWQGLQALLDALGLPSIPVGGSLGQALIKVSDDDYDIGWGWVASVVPPGDIVVPDGSITGGDDTGTYTDGPFTYRWHRFTTVGTSSLVVTKGVIGRLQLDGAGASGGAASSGGHGGGGGAGAHYEQDYAFGIGTHLVQIGAGGVYAGGQGTDGAQSRFDDIIAYGGGGGGWAAHGSNGRPGGSGGGGASDSTGGDATYGSIDGGLTTNSVLFDCSDGTDGGGGSTGVGGGANSGAGRSLALDGTSRTYAAGGLSAGSGGVPVANTGSGGRGAEYAGVGPTNGADGVAIVRYRIA